MSTPALADATDDLEARIAALESMIGELRGELQAVRAEQAATADTIERLPAAAPAPAATAAPAAAPANGFQVGDTRVSIGGFVDADYHVTDISDGEIAPNSIARDFYIPGAIPVGGSGDGGADGDFTAQGSRFFLTTETPTENGSVRGRIEMDFLGSPGGDERVSNSYNPRLRVAWLEHGHWRFGQDWSTFQNTSAIPESASFLVGSDGMIFVRQPQLRYTNGNWQLAIENPDTTVTPYGGGARINAGDGALPDVVVRYNHSGPRGNLSVAGLVRNLAYETPGMDASAMGWGVSASGRLNLGEGSDIRASLTYGEGVGRYIGLNAVNGAVVTAAGDLEAIPVLGGLAAWRQMLDEDRRINLGVSWLEADNDVTLTGMSATRSVRSAFANYMVDIAPRVTVGAELLFGEREIESGATGSLSRITFSTKYNF
ncbi:MAG: hypothetical protein CMF75_07330 [Maricaulis sp.]|nr:hypothetical protein [Maricaulis sp.]